MKRYFFDFEAFPISSDGIGHGGKGQWSLIADNYEQAYEKACEYFKTNEQFRFEFRLALIEDNI